MKIILFLFYFVITLATAYKLMDYPRDSGDLGLV